MSEGVPERWQLRRLDDVAKIIMGQSPSSETYNTERNGLPFFQGKADFGNHYTKTRYWCSEPTKIAPANSILFSVRAPVGDINITQQKCCIGRGLSAIIGNSIIQPFLYQNLQYAKSQFQLISQGSTFEAVNGSDLKEFRILTPPLPEQKKIAAILTSVDEVIEKTEAQINKLQDLKKAMMQTLLTEGIGHTEFKDSPVGRIPKEWKVSRLEALLVNVDSPMRSGPFGSALLKKELVSQGNPLLGIDNVHIEKFVKNYKRFVTDDKFEELKRYAVREDDVMITIMGTVGRSCVVPKNVGKALSSKHVWTMTFDKDKYEPELICWQLNYATWVLSQFKNESQGGVMDSINSKTLKNLLLPNPPLEEQAVIATNHKSISHVIEEKQTTLVSLISLKKSLMQDILTGKVRVKVN